MTNKIIIDEEEQRDREWGNLAMSSFASDWNSEKDAIYDNWRDRYRIHSA